MTARRQAPRRRAIRPAPVPLSTVPVCAVWQVFPRSECGAVTVRRFAASCQCEHPIEGWACPACLGSPKLGCMRCWELPASRRHKCDVTVVVGE